MVICFSGTGNSRWCGQVIARALGEELVDANGYIKRGERLNVSDPGPLVFAAPIYAWQMPRVFADFLRKCTFPKGAQAWFIFTCGGDIGGAGSKAAQLCGELGLTYRGALEVVLPENYVALFKVPEREECVAALEKAKPLLAGAAEHIRRGEDFPQKKTGFADRLKSGPVNKGFYARYVSAKKFRTTDKCISCGKCVELCPLNNITLQEGKPVWGEDCTHCMACISYCPTETIEYGEVTVGRRRYRCEDHLTG